MPKTWHVSWNQTRTVRSSLWNCVLLAGSSRGKKDRDPSGVIRAVRPRLGATHSGPPRTAGPSPRCNYSPLIDQRSIASFPSLSLFLRLFYIMTVDRPPVGHFKFTDIYFLSPTLPRQYLSSSIHFTQVVLSKDQDCDIRMHKFVVWFFWVGWGHAYQNSLDERKVLTLNGWF